MGEFNLTEASKNFIPYTGVETLTFLDNNGIEHTLTSQAGRKLEPTRMIVRTICEEGFLDRTEMFFNIEREQTAYFDSTGQQVFYTDLLTTFEDNSNVDSIAIYDYLYVSGVLAGNSLGEIRIITDQRQNQVSETHRIDFFDHSRLIGDTTLYEQAFSEVFVDITGNGKGIYYNKEKGVVAFKLSEDEFWVLKE